MGPGIQLAAAMWAIAALVVALVVLRLYTRLCLVRFVGAEDYLYVATGVLFVAFAAAIHVAVHFGLGRSFWSLSLASSSHAILWTYIANSLAIAANAMAKLAMALFLLRVVQLRWHKIALWLLAAVTASTSAALLVMLWNQSTPAKHSWDPFRTPGTWHLKIQPTSVGLGVWSSAADFFLCIFPWLIIWSLRMPRRDKIMLAGSMSLGVFAGVCGIVRTVVLARLSVLDYTRNFVSYFAWAGAEVAVAMVCLGIPALRPLYLKWCRPVRGDGVRAAPAAPAAPADAERGAAPAPAQTQSGVSTPHSSPDSVQGEKFEAMQATAASVLPARPPRTQRTQRTHGRTQDSVDEILGLYDGNGLGHALGPVWMSKARVDRAAATNWPLRT